jgi:hypothetical protein
MAGAVLGASQPLPTQVEDRYTASATFVFRLLLASLVWIVVALAAPVLVDTLNVSLPVAQGTLLLVGMGLLHLGITTRPLRVLLGLLTALAGFELIYAAIETSVLVAGLLAVVTLGLALVGAYLLDSGQTALEAEEEPDVLDGSQQAGAGQVEAVPARNIAARDSAARDFSDGEEGQ